MKSKKGLSLLLSFLIIISFFAGCSTQNTGQLQAPVNAETFINAVYPENEAVINLHTKKQTSYLNKSVLLMPLNATGKKELSRPEPVELKWTYNGTAVSEYKISISENADMSNAAEYTSYSESLTVTNLKIAENYYWTVSAADYQSNIYSFTTDSLPPRCIDAEGVKNIRDLGGRETSSKSRTKQGLIYRCGRLNESSADAVNIEITEQGKAVMLNDLKIKSEIDLRKTYDNEVGGITSSPLGNDVSYYPCPMEWEGDIFNQNKEQILNVFSILADKNNYPLIFHCNIGTDRTGMISFLVNALLGVPEEELIKDYMFSNLANIGGTRKASQLKNSGYYKAVMAAQGDTLSEKTYNCLADFGVPKQQLDAVISILS